MENETSRPEGFPRIAEYGDSRTASHKANYVVHQQAIGALHGFPIVRLQSSTAGYAIAGSAMRWDEARWSVLWEMHDGSTHGQSFLVENESKARELFAKLTDAAAVQAKRDECDKLEREVYAPARAARAAEIEARKQAERDRKNARRRQLKSMKG